MLALLTGEAAESPFPFDACETVSPESVGLDSELLKTLVQKIRAGEFQNIHSLLIVRDGKLALEEYFSGVDERRGEPLGTVQFESSNLHDLRSVTKSVVSIG
jgi:CubicO group peptidase (beta-lactamase class C family)